jgi:hypothetical protein
VQKLSPLSILHFFDFEVDVGEPDTGLDFGIFSLRHVELFFEFDSSSRLMDRLRGQYFFDVMGELSSVKSEGDFSYKRSVSCHLSTLLTLSGHSVGFHSQPCSHSWTKASSTSKG